MLPGRGQGPLGARFARRRRKQAVDAALDRQRFEGDAASAAEQFIDDDGTRAAPAGRRDRRRTSPAEAAEKLGGTAVARLLTSGETKAVIDLSGLGFDADAAAASALAAALRSWRYDRYRTKLKDKQKPTLERIVDRRRRRRARQSATQAAGSRSSKASSLTRELVTEPANIIYPESFVERVRASLEGTGIEIEVLDRRGDGEARHGRAARRRPGLGPRGAAAGPALERRRGRRRSRPPSSARA